MLSSRQILTQAVRLTKTHKFLWVYGLLLFLGQTLNAIYTYLSETNSIPAWLRDFQSHEWAIWGLVILSCMWLLIYFRAKAAMILAAKLLIDREQAEPLKLFYVGRFFLARLLGLAIVLQLGFLVLSILIGGPIFYLATMGLGSRALILGIFGVIVSAPFVFMLLFLSILGSLFIVLYNLPLKAALTGALGLIGACWRKLLSLGLWIFAIRIAALALTLLACSPLVIYGYLSYYSGGSLSFMVSLIGSSIIFLAAGSAMSVFEQIVWVIMFGEVVKPQKVENPEAEVVPEAIT